jgi:AAA domain
MDDDALHRLESYSPPNSGERTDPRARPLRFPLTAFGEIKPDEDAQYLIKGLLSSSGLVVVWGAPKCGKSFWSLDALMHVALGWKYRGRRVRAGAVIYCVLEGQRGFKNRIEAFRHAKLGNNSPSPPFYIMSRPLSLVCDSKALIEDIRSQLGDTKPAAVCLDTLNRSLDGSESSDEDMAAYIRAADLIRAAFDCAVVIVHHCGHNGARPRGHSSLMGALDVQIVVRRDAADNVVAELELSKDGEVGLQFVSRLRVVEVGVDQDGDAITSCVIEEVEGAAISAAKPANARRPPKSAQTALRALQKAINEVGEQAPASNTIPASARVVHVETWRTYAYLSGISDSNETDAKRMAFKRAHGALVNGGYVKAHDDYRWIGE